LVVLPWLHLLLLAWWLALQQQELGSRSLAASFAVAAVALLLRLGHHRFHDCRSGLPGYSFTSRPRPAKGLLLFPSVCAIRKS